MVQLHPLQPFGYRGKARSLVTCPTLVPGTSIHFWQLVLDNGFFVSVPVTRSGPHWRAETKVRENGGSPRARAGARLASLPAGHLLCLLFAFFSAILSFPCQESSFQRKNASTSLPYITHWQLCKEARKHSEILKENFVATHFTGTQLLLFDAAVKSQSWCATASVNIVMTEAHRTLCETIRIAYGFIAK